MSSENEYRYGRAGRGRAERIDGRHELEQEHKAEQKRFPAVQAEAQRERLNPRILHLGRRTRRPSRMRARKQRPKAESEPLRLWDSFGRKAGQKPPGATGKMTGANNNIDAFITYLHRRLTTLARRCPSATLTRLKGNCSRKPLAIVRTARTATTPTMTGLPSWCASPRGWPRNTT